MSVLESSDGEEEVEDDDDDDVEEYQGVESSGSVVMGDRDR